MDMDGGAWDLIEPGFWASYGGMEFLGRQGRGLRGFKINERNHLEGKI